MTDPQITRYLDDGYLVCEGLVEDAVLAEIAADIPRIARNAYDAKGNFPDFGADPTDQQIIDSLLCIHQPHYVSPVIRRHVEHPAVSAVLGRITAAHLPWWDGSVKCMQSMLFVKPPGFQGQAWHQDEIYIPTRDRSLVGAWIALDDATIENGCLWVKPGSHRTGYLWPQREHGREDEFDFGAESYGFDEADEIPVEVPRGSVVFFNGYLLHRSRRNRSNACRKVLVNHYMNAWSLLPWQVREGEAVAAADRRNVVPVTGTDPYAWKGYETSTRIFFRPTLANQDANQEAHRDT